MHRFDPDIPPHFKNFKKLGISKEKPSFFIPQTMEKTIVKKDNQNMSKILTQMYKINSKIYNVILIKLYIFLCFFWKNIDFSGQNGILIKINGLIIQGIFFLHLSMDIITIRKTILECYSKDLC